MYNWGKIDHNHFLDIHVTEKSITATRIKSEAEWLAGRFHTNVCN
jgi:hypothetical protein